MLLTHRFWASTMERFLTGSWFSITKMSKKSHENLCIHYVSASLISANSITLKSTDAVHWGEFIIISYIGNVCNCSCICFLASYSKPMEMLVMWLVHIPFQLTPWSLFRMRIWSISLIKSDWKWCIHLGECHCWWTRESPWAHVAKFYGRLWLVRSVLRASNFGMFKIH